MFRVKWLKAVKLLLQVVSVQTLGICTAASVIFSASEPDILNPPPESVVITSFPNDLFQEIPSHWFAAPNQKHDNDSSAKITSSLIHEILSQVKYN